MTPPPPPLRRIRLGIPVTYQFSVRYLLHTGLLQRLGEAVQPVVLLSWSDDELRAQLEAAGAMIRAIRRGFTHPGEGAEGRRRLLTEVISFTDGRATERVAAGVCDALGLPTPRSGSPGAPHPSDVADAGPPPR